FVGPVVAGQSTGGNLALQLAWRTPAGFVAGVAGVDGGLLQLQDRWPRWEDCLIALAPPRFDGIAAATFESSVRRSHPDWSDAGVAATLANCEVRPDGTV